MKLAMMTIVLATMASTAAAWLNDRNECIDHCEIMKKDMIADDFKGGWATKFNIEKMAWEEDAVR